MVDTLGLCLRRRRRQRRSRRRRHPRCHTFGVRSITFEGMHQLEFYWKFTEG